jgi:hypothetical protein
VILKRIHDLRAHLNLKLEVGQVKDRATWQLDSIISEIEEDPSDQEIAQITAKLEALEKWLDPVQTDNCYWGDLHHSITRLLSKIETGDFPTQGEAEMKKLKNELEIGVKSQPSHDGMIELEKSYQRLRILWGRHHDDELFHKLLAVKQDSASHLFALVDNADWKRMEKTAKENQIFVKGPSPDSMNPVEAYMPVTIMLDTTNNPDLLETFLVQKKLKYTWKFEIYKQDFWRRNVKIGGLEVESAEPKVTQYSPVSGQIVLKEVCIWNAAEKTKIVIRVSEV